jgi:hypothetical protein
MARAHVSETQLDSMTPEPETVMLYSHMQTQERFPTHVARVQ